MTFSEDDHPRDDHGRFASGGGSAGSHGAAVSDRAAESARSINHELKQLAIGAALTAAVTIGVALAPEAAAVAGVIGVSEAAVSAAGALVVGEARRAATGALHSAGFSAANQILKGMGVDTSQAERIGRVYNDLFKAEAAASDEAVLAALRPHLLAVADDTATVLKAEVRRRNPDAAADKLAAACDGIDASLSDFKAAIDELGKTTVPVSLDKVASILARPPAAGERADVRHELNRRDALYEVRADVLEFGKNLDKLKATLLPTHGGLAKAAGAATEIVARLDCILAQPVPLWMRPPEGTA